MNDTLECVLELFLESIRLQDIDDADKQEQPFAFVVTCWNAAGTMKRNRKFVACQYEKRPMKYSRNIFLLVNWFALRLDTLHSRGMRN